jgi:plasmid stabilization system protein ParE
MSYSVSVLRAARNEYLDAVEWYAKRSPKAAEGFMLNFSSAVQLIAASPSRWPSYHGHFHEFVMKDYPFTVVYRIDERKNAVVIVSVFHQSRHPKGEVQVGGLRATPKKVTVEPKRIVNIVL